MATKRHTWFFLEFFFPINICYITTRLFLFVVHRVNRLLLNLIKLAVLDTYTHMAQISNKKQVCPFIKEYTDYEQRG